MKINKYQQAYQNVQAELPVDNEDIVILRELVEKSIPKKTDVKLALFYPYCTTYEFNCPNCGRFIFYSNDNETNIFRGHPDHCPRCGQALKWSDER